MTGAPDLDAAIARGHAALHAILNGDPSCCAALFSPAEDVTLGNPFGLSARGRAQVEATLAGAARGYRNGVVLGVERLSLHQADGLACVVEVERGRAEIAGAPAVSEISPRVTSLYRREPDGWRLLHRHADPITAPRAAESVIAGRPAPPG